jgi:hypothetical protein
MYFFLSFFKNGAKNKKIKKMTCLKKKRLILTKMSNLKSLIHSIRFYIHPQYSNQFHQTHD